MRDLLSVSYGSRIDVDVGLLGPHGVGPIGGSTGGRWIEDLMYG